jgi:hypothetical protein
VEIYSFDGRRIYGAELPAGGGRIAWDGRTDAGLPVAAGVYFVRVVEAGRAVMERRVIRLD